LILRWGVSLETRGKNQGSIYFCFLAICNIIYEAYPAGKTGTADEYDRERYDSLPP
jgi:hypothetical protein